MNRTLESREQLFADARNGEACFYEPLRESRLKGSPLIPGRRPASAMARLPSGGSVLSGTSPAELVPTVSDFEQPAGGSSNENGVTYCTFCNSPEEHWARFRNKYHSVIKNAGASEAAARAALARETYGALSFKRAVRARHRRMILEEEQQQRQRSRSAEGRGRTPSPRAVSEGRRDHQSPIMTKKSSIGGVKTKKGATRAKPSGVYKLVVKSGEIGTAAKVRVKLVGNEASSTFHELRRPPQAKPFHFFSKTAEVFFLPFKRLGTEIRFCHLQVSYSCDLLAVMLIIS